MFDDEDLVFAITKFQDDPYTLVTLAQLVLHIWSSISDTPPTAANLACFYETKWDWEKAVKEQWHRCSLGMNWSDSIEKCSYLFWATIQQMRDKNRQSRSQRVIDGLRSNSRAINRLRFAQLKLAAHLQRITLFEVRTPRGLSPPGQVAKHKPKPVIEGLSDGEAELLSIAIEAGKLSGHHGMLSHQASEGVSEFFPETLKNLLGNIKQGANYALLHTWRRWRRYIKETPTQWKAVQERVALFSPSAGCLAHYAGVRSAGGVTAARGAMTCLWRLVTALKLTFPFDESGVNGWNVRLRDHVVKPRIPFEVAQLAHFDYHAKYNDNPFVLVICCSVWFAFWACAETRISRGRSLLSDASMGGFSTASLARIDPNLSIGSSRRPTLVARLHRER